MLQASNVYIVMGSPGTSGVVMKLKNIQPNQSGSTFDCLDLILYWLVITGPQGSALCCALDCSNYFHRARNRLVDRLNPKTQPIRFTGNL